MAVRYMSRGSLGFRDRRAAVLLALSFSFSARRLSASLRSIILTCDDVRGFLEVNEEDDEERIGVESGSAGCAYNSVAEGGSSLSGLRLGNFNACNPSIAADSGKLSRSSAVSFL